MADILDLLPRDAEIGGYLPLYYRGVGLIDARIGLVSNNREFLYKSEYFKDRLVQCLLTDFYKIDEVPFDLEMDGYMYIVDQEGVPASITILEDKILAIGNFSLLEEKVVDRRYTLFGNLGLLFKFFCSTLERAKDTVSFHASAMYDERENELYLIVGGPGAGKTVLLLEGIKRGYKIFSAEMTHFRFTTQGCVFYKGALFDNIRIGNLIYDFPETIGALKLDIPQVKDPWATKIAVDLGVVQVPADTLLNPELTLLFPKIEAGRDKAIISDITSRPKLIKMLFDNAGEKIGGALLLYETIPVDSLDSPILMKKRLHLVERLVETQKIRRAKSILAGSKNCMEGI